jgi:hypothetical protein
MANKIKLKQSSVSGKVPTTTDLDLGELGINTYDGKLFLKQKVGAVETIIDVTGAASGVTSVSGSAPIVSSGGVTPSISISAATTLAAGSMSAADKTKIDAVTGTNTGDETASTIKTKLGITTLSGSNTGDQTITLTGDITGSGSGSFVTTLATITDSGTGTFKKITTNSKGLITGSVAVAQADITGLLGAGSISNTMLANSAVANLSGTNTGDQVIPIASSTAPAALGTAAVGTGTTFARADHVHTLPSLATLGAQAAGSYVTVGGALGTPSSGTVTNLTGTASININGTVGATTANSGAFTTVTASSNITANGRVIGTSPNSGSTGAVVLKNAVGDPDTLYLQAINNAGSSQYSSIQFKTDGSIIASGAIEATQFNGSWQYLPSGTRMSFQQTAAPTGWTKDTTAAIDNSACRFVTGTASSGGSVAFTTAFASQAVTGTNGASAAYTLGTADIPSHTHVVPTYEGTGSTASGGTLYYSRRGDLTYQPLGAAATGGGGAHSHGAASFTGNAINLAVKYYDFIIASKN